MQTAFGSRTKTNEWVLGVVAVSCGLHAIEEYFTGWQLWAREGLGIVVPTSLFVVMNAILVALAISLARVGWRRPALSLVIPVATLVNGICFHILPTLLQESAAPGIYTAVLLYLPFSSWALIGAARDGVRGSAIAVAVVAGSILALSIVAGARLLTGAGV